MTLPQEERRPSPLFSLPFFQKLGWGQGHAGGAVQGGTGEDYLRIEGLSFAYDRDTQVFRDLTLSLAKGDIVALIGESGSGKSTLLQLLAGEERESRGKILLQGVSQSGGRRRSMTHHVNQTMGYQFETKKVSKEIPQEGHSLLSVLQLEDVMERNPATLSGGQKQRLAVAVGVSAPCPVLCYDEPTSGLDSDAMELVARVIKGAEEKTQFIVTHDYDLVRLCCNKVLYLKQGEPSQLLEFSSHQETILRWMEGLYG